MKTGLNVSPAKYLAKLEVKREKIRLTFKRVIEIGTGKY